LKKPTGSFWRDHIRTQAFRQPAKPIQQTTMMWTVTRLSHPISEMNINKNSVNL